VGKTQQPHSSRCHSVSGCMLTQDCWGQVGQWVSRLGGTDKAGAHITQMRVILCDRYRQAPAVKAGCYAMTWGPCLALQLLKHALPAMAAQSNQCALWHATTYLSPPPPHTLPVSPHTTCLAVQLWLRATEPLSQ
jgi:hypothetical protein